MARIGKRLVKQDAKQWEIAPPYSATIRKISSQCRCVEEQTWRPYNLLQDIKKYKFFCQQAEADDDTNYPIIAEPSQVFTDDEEEQQDKLSKHDQPKKVTWPEGDSKLNSSENKLQGVVENSQRARIITSESDIHIKMKNYAAELLAIHCRCGHIGFSRLQEMAGQGIINSKFAKYQLPVCSSGLYAQATKRR